MDDTEHADDGGEIDLVAVFPRLTQLGTVLNRSSLVERAMEQVGRGLDRPAMSVLVTLHMAGQPLRVGEIARRMQVVGPRVTRQVNDLERRGLARRVADPDDQRARLIELAPEGTAAAGPPPPPPPPAVPPAPPLGLGPPPGPPPLRWGPVRPPPFL